MVCMTRLLLMGPAYKQICQGACAAHPTFPVPGGPYSRKLRGGCRMPRNLGPWYQL